MSTQGCPEFAVATAADEGYVLPLAVTIRSAIDSLSPGRRMRLFVLDGGITPASRVRLERSWNDPRVRVEWVSPDLDAVGHLPVSDHVSIATYLRLQMPDLLPPDVQNLVYLDSDMLVRRDLGDLADLPLRDDLALAAQEMAAPWIDAQAAAEGYGFRERYLSAARPIPNYKQLGLRPDAPYFNSGLLVLDARRWRDERVGQQVFDCLETNRDHVLWWDQYALNVVLSDKWRPLDVRWNQTASVFNYPSWRESPLNKQQFRQARRDPWVVHYCSPSKPWHYFCDHPYRHDFYRTLARTDWRGWRPDPPADLFNQTLSYYRGAVSKTFKTLKARAKSSLRPAA